MIALQLFLSIVDTFRYRFFKSASHKNLCNTNLRFSLFTRTAEELKSERIED
jgi:hypothetical protein